MEQKHTRGSNSLDSVSYQRRSVQYPHHTNRSNSPAPNGSIGRTAPHSSIGRTVTTNHVQQESLDTRAPKRTNLNWFKVRLTGFLGSVRRVFLRIWVSIRPYAKKALKRLRKLPWLIISSVLISILIIWFLAFHFFIASRDRIVGQFESNIETLSQIEQSIQFADASLRNSPLDSLAEFTTQADILTEDLRSASASLPGERSARYALRGDDQLNERLNTLFNTETETDLAQATLTADNITEISRTIDELYMKNIKADPRGYVTFVISADNRFAEIDEANNDISLRTIRKILTQIKLSAEQFVETNNYEQFVFGYNNVSSELNKEIIVVWDETINGPYNAELSFLLSTQEAIVNLVLAE